MKTSLNLSSLLKGAALFVVVFLSSNSLRAQNSLAQINNLSGLPVFVDIYTAANCGTTPSGSCSVLSFMVGAGTTPPPISSGCTDPIVSITIHVGGSSMTLATPGCNCLIGTPTTAIGSAGGVTGTAYCTTGLGSSDITVDLL